MSDAKSPPQDSLFMPIAHVIGLGRSGIASARVLNQQGWQVCVSDANQANTLLETQQKLEQEGIRVILGWKFDLETLETQGLSQPDRIVVSPGVPWQLPSLEASRSQGIETMGEMELAWLTLQDKPWVGITGTNGKTTTTAMIAAIFQAAGLQAPACGNIGYSACELALTDQPIDWVIAEISSYQIESSTTLAPQIGVWTTFTPDHLERHHTIENYRNIKTRLLDQSHQQILNGDDPYLSSQLADRWPHAHWTRIHGPTPAVTPDGNPALTQPTAYLEADWVMVAGERILPVQSLRMPGAHNQQNLLLAVTVAHLAGIDREAIAQAIANFGGVPHRLESLGTWQGIEFINDSKATNYDAAQTGLAAVASPAILIAGGDPKVGDDTLWLKTIQTQAAAVVLIGKAAPTFAQRLEAIGYQEYEILETMVQAVPRSAELAQQHQAKVILLSPACASFDQYPNFEQRGEDFRQCCQQLFTATS